MRGFGLVDVKPASPARRPPGARVSSRLRMWRNWQTRGVQVAVGATPWRFEPSHPHWVTTSPNSADSSVRVRPRRSAGIEEHRHQPDLALGGVVVLDPLAASLPDLGQLLV